MSTVTTRYLTTTDELVLRIATLGNLNWAEDRFRMRDVVDRPEFAHYTRLDLARGDFGFVAEQGGHPVGAVWAVFLPAEDPGYGFVDRRTPEVSLWIHADARGHGLGRRLLRLLKDEARRRDINALSLSVEEENFAKQLYGSEGFRAVPGRERDGVMTWSSGDGVSDHETDDDSEADSGDDTEAETGQDDSTRPSTTWGPISPR